MVDISNPLELKSVFYDRGEGKWTTTNPEIDTIVKRTDGHGLTGYYDMIYIYFNNGDILEIPAHNTFGWMRKVEEETADD